MHLASYPDAAGELDGTLSATSAVGHALFLDVRPGLYELSAERDGVHCDSTEIWLDGGVDQFIAPELHCD